MKKIVVNTGANSGIGKAATIQFTGQGYRGVMACRNMETGIPVCREIIGKTNNENVEVIPLDISSKQSILAFCAAFKNKYDVLDILINNAGHFTHREFACLQNPFIPRAEVIGEAYFSICTDKRYHGVTGNLINHLGQIVQAADQSISFVKIMRGIEYYPHYVEDKETPKRVWA